MIYIYILELCNNKYYIGKLYDISKLEDTILELDESFEWFYYNNIKKFANIRSFEEDFDENFLIYELMQHLGVHNIRGGKFNKINITTENTNDIFNNMKTEYNKCYLCGYYNHNGNQCRLKNKYNYNLLVNLVTSSVTCFKCFEKGHYEYNCRRKQVLNNDIDIIISV